MAKSSVMASADRATTINHEDTGNRIRAYLASMRKMPGCEWDEETQEQIDRGRSLMEHLAISAPGEGAPTLRLSSTDCADILTYMSCSSPIDAGWWNDRAKISHVCGYNAVLDAMADSLRPADEEPAEASEEPTGPDEPKTVEIRLVRLRARQLQYEAICIQSVLKCVGELLREGLDDSDVGGAEVAQIVRMAVEKLGEISDEFDDGLTEAPSDDEREQLERTMS